MENETAIVEFWAGAGILIWAEDHLPAGIVFHIKSVDDMKRFTSLEAFVSRREAKLVFYDIVHCLFDEWQWNRQTAELLGKCSLTIRKDPKYRCPYVFKMDAVNEEGVKTINALLSETQARQFAMAIHDRIRDWEINNYREKGGDQ